ncbi:MAG TPA: restriction endonuclease subunit S [Bacteroidales bacterium]|nr:restriction endonuclease subunit S [Bacteroidales bacterium]HQB75899.1 restriction endonuclease subunit S [Bacteroidales bacterium]
MSEWKEYKISDIADVIGGGTPSTSNSSYWNGNIPWLTPRDLTGYTKVYISKGERNITVEGLRNSSARLLPKGTVLLTSRAPIGYVAIAKNEITTNQGFKSLVLKEDYADSEFIYYWIKNNIDYLQSIGTGTTFAEISGRVVKDIEISLPPLSEQKSIASVLSSLDDKIDLLHRQNATLEKMAETLFRQWFVERCPEPVEGEEKEEWEIKKLEAIAEIQNGFAFSSKDYVEYADTHLEVFKMGHIQKGGGLRTDPKRDYVPRSERLKRWILNKGDIVMAMTDMKDNVVILGVPAMIDKDDNYVLNQRVARIYLKDKSNLISNYLLFIQLKDVDFIQELQSKANSGVQVNLSTESIKDSDIIIPPLAIQKEKSPIIDDLYTKVELNQTQIRTLTALRDTLLPKLMSGEVRVEKENI